LIEGGNQKNISVANILSHLVHLQNSVQQLNSNQLELDVNNITNSQAKLSREVKEDHELLLKLANETNHPLKNQVDWEKHVEEKIDLLVSKIVRKHCNINYFDSTKFFFTPNLFVEYNRTNC